MGKRIFNLFDDYEVIAHIFNGDPFIEKKVTEELNFFKKKQANCEVLPGIIKVIDSLNNEFNFLTDREKIHRQQLLMNTVKKSVSIDFESIF